MKRGRPPKLPTVANNPNLVASPLPELRKIRDDALEGRARTDHIIAELDAWRNEIDATLAFLKAQRK